MADYGLSGYWFFLICAVLVIWNLFFAWYYKEENCSSDSSARVYPVIVRREGDGSWPGLGCSGCGKQ